MNQKRNPGVSRKERLADDGLIRLEKHLKNGSPMTQVVLERPRKYRPCRKIR